MILFHKNFYLLLLLLLIINKADDTSNCCKYIRYLIHKKLNNNFSKVTKVLMHKI